MSASRAGYSCVLALGCLLALGCGAQRELSACDIATESCQEDIFYAIVRLRGDGFDPFEGVPPIRTLTVEEYRAELLRRRTPPKPVDPDAEPKIKPWDVALELLGLIKPKVPSSAASVDDAVRNVAAFYSSGDRRVTVIDRGGNRNDRNDTTLLAHELVHAFQDNEIGDLYVGTTDAAYAARALTEGEATLYEELVGAEIKAQSGRALDWDHFYGGWIANLRNDLPRQESVFYAANWFIYPLGGNALTEAWLEGGNASVRKLQARAFDSMIDYLGRFSDFEPEPVAELDCTVELPSESFAVSGLDRFGALQTYAFLAKAGLAEEHAWTTALAWRDDRLQVFFDEDAKTVAVSWRVRFESAAAAREAEQAIADTERRVLDAVDGDLLVHASTDPELLTQWPSTTDCAR